MRIILILLLSLLKQNIIAQTGIVYYGHKQSFGMGAPIGVDYNAELVFNAKNSTYTFASDSLEGGHIAKMNVFKNEKRHFMIMKRTTEKGFIYNMDRNANLIQSRDIGYNYVKDKIPKISWKIENETKEIGKFKCTKATCSFRGRDYTAWFATSIPLPYGPWKLQGLPGLILEAYDADKEIFFYFKSIEYPSTKPFRIKTPNPKTNTDMERNWPTTKRDWITFEGFKEQIIERHNIGTKVGRMLSEQTQSILQANSSNPMRNGYIEIFDED